MSSPGFHFSGAAMKLGYPNSSMLSDNLPAHGRHNGKDAEAFFIAYESWSARKKSLGKLRMMKAHLTCRYWRLSLQEMRDRRALFKCTSDQAKRFREDIKKGMYSPQEQEKRGGIVWRLYAEAMNERESCISNCPTEESNGWKLTQSRISLSSYSLSRLNDHTQALWDE